MADQLSLRGGTTAEHATFTGANKEVTVDTTKKTLVVNDGATVGGHPLMRENASNSALALGSAATPSLKFTGDTNTGIYSPGADKVAVATNGVGRLFIDSSGNVGIGTASPNNYANYSTLTLDGTTGSIIDLEANGTICGELQALANEFRINAVGASGVLKMYAGASERMRITSAGLVGVGTSAPGAKLDVVGGFYRGINGTSTTYLGDGASLVSGASASSTALRFDGDSLRFAANNVAKMTLTSGGSLGIGTSAPTGTLHLKHATDANIFFRNGSSAGLSTGTILECFNDAISATTPLYARASQFQFGTDSAGTFVPRMTVTSGGLVGIGTASPAEELHIVAAAPYIQVEATGGVTGSAYYGFNNATGGADIVSSSHIRFAVPGLEAARIDTSGRLLVGTSTRVTGANQPQYAKLQVVGNSLSGARAGLIALGRSAAASTIVAGDQVGGITFGDNAAGEFAYIFGEADGAAGTNDYPGRLVFSTTADGASSPTERLRIGADGLIRAYGLGNSIIAASAQAAGTTFAALICRHSASSTTTGTTSFQVMTNGDAQNTNNSYGAISDIKLKENIVDANSQWDDLKALQVRNYNFKEGQTHTQIGLVAQEVELVSPGLVSESPDRDEDGNDLGTVTKSVNYSVLYMKAVKALQEAMERIETLEQRLNYAGIN